MGKDRKTVSLADDVIAYLDQPGVNASGTVEQAVRNLIAGGENDREILLLRRDMIQERIEHHDTEKRRLQNELEAIERRLEETDDQLERTIAQAVNVLEPYTLKDVNDAVRNWASKADVEPRTFLEELRDAHPEWDDGDQ